MSLKFQANDTSVENVTTCVATTLSGVCGLGTTLGSHEAAFLREVGDGTVYKGQELIGDRDSAILNVSRNKQAVLDAIAAHLQRRFSSFENEDIFKNMSIVNFKNWPLGLEELQVCGNEQLIRNDCDIDSVPLEWIELKIYVSGLVTAEPAVSYTFSSVTRPVINSRLSQNATCMPWISIRLLTE